MKIIYDTNLVHIPVLDNGEELVDIRDFTDKIKVRLEPESRRFFGKNICLVRKSVALKLSRIAENLNGMRLVIYDGYRPPELQKKLYQDLYNKIKLKNPEWKKERIEKECSKFIAPVLKGVIPPHSTGGAVDITIECKGKLLDMGTKAGDFSERSFTNSRLVPIKARKNREILKRAMSKEGFHNYPLEWWHWSYGERNWAFAKKQKNAFYGTVPFNKAMEIIKRKEVENGNKKAASR